MRTPIFALLVVTAAASGCTFLAGQAGDGPPVPDGPHFWVDVVSELPGEATVSIRVDDGDARQLSVPAGGTESMPVGIPAHGPHVARLDYWWSGGGEGATGSNEASIDTAGCGGVVHLHVTLSTSEDGAFSTSSTSCADA